MRRSSPPARLSRSWRDCSPATRRSGSMPRPPGPPCDRSPRGPSSAPPRFPRPTPDARATARGRCRCRTCDRQPHRPRPHRSRPHRSRRHRPRRRRSRRHRRPPRRRRALRPNRSCPAHHWYAGAGHRWTAAPAVATRPRSSRWHCWCCSVQRVSGWRWSPARAHATPLPPRAPVLPAAAPAPAALPPAARRPAPRPRAPRRRRHPRPARPPQRSPRMWRRCPRGGDRSRRTATPAPFRPPTPPAASRAAPVPRCPHRADRAHLHHRSRRREG